MLRIRVPRRTVAPRPRVDEDHECRWVVKEVMGKICIGVANASVAGDIMRRDVQLRSQEKFRSAEDAVEECPMGDRGCGGERVQGGVEDGRSGPGLAGRGRRGGGEAVERLRCAHPPAARRHSVWGECADHQHAREDNLKPNRIDTKIDSHLRCVSRAAPRFVPYPRTDEVSER